jgi:O-antigen biosynthesis protein
MAKSLERRVRDLDFLRPRTRGKFLFAGEEKLYVRGVTYGPFRPSENGSAYHSPEAVERDFAQIAANGLNAVRTYTTPERWLLDAAQRHGLRVMVGLSWWEQHLASLNDDNRVESIKEHIRAGVSACVGHPAVLCYVIGNEIPAPIVRWYGRRRVERFLKELYEIAKAEDPEGLVTYVNYPTTEYLQLPFLDFVSFNVYLEEQQHFEAYLARLHNIAGNRPVIMGEIGLDSRRNGEDAQAHSLKWQIRSSLASGCAGAVVFSWTDEWFTGGFEIEDWDFGLTDRDRCPKPALAAVKEAFAEAPLSADLSWPRFSVIVCSHNGEHTLPDCLEGLLEVEYPDFEVIVVDDGSTDSTADIVREYGFRLITTENLGLSNARNIGMQAASAEIIGYLDDDARPDPHWLTYLAATFLSTEHAGVGGPNITHPGDEPIAECVGKAPGNPTHVLLSDREAEHIPGCNMAFRKAYLEEIGAFDTRFRVAGDDVDVCWRLRQRGWSLGFSPAAVVWHHRRNSIRAYWKQQRGYGKAEALLKEKWPEMYNAYGHLVWAGRIYDERLMSVLSWRRPQIYQGTWGSAPFQSLYQPAPNGLWSLLATPEWYLLIMVLATLCALGTAWRPLLLFLPLLGLAVGARLIQVGLSSSDVSFTGSKRSRLSRLKLFYLTAFLHVIHPLARLYGHLRHGLSPWRGGATGRSLPQPRTIAIWSERWQAPDERLRSIEATLRGYGVAVHRGGDYDRWDLEVRGGMLGVVRLLMANEEYPAGKQLLRFRIWPRWPSGVPLLTLLFAALGLWAALDGAWVVCAILGAAAVLLALRALQECAVASAVALSVLEKLKEDEREPLR